MRPLIVLSCFALLVGQIGVAESTAQNRHVLTTQMTAASPSLPPGGFKWVDRLIIFPLGCKYIAHDVELLENLPKLEPSDHAKITDGLRKPHPDSAVFDRLSVMIAAYRPKSLSAGPASISVKVQITVECEDEALAKLVKDAGLEHVR